MTAKLAGAPISWGVCEVPGWGHQLDADRVLAEMREVGYTATEFGPAGFLPEDAAGRVAALSAAGLSAVGGFVPVLLHDPDHDPLPELEAELAVFTEAGAGTMVLAAASGSDGYDARPQLDAAQWATLLGNLDRIAARAGELGILAVVHPHVGTMVETPDDIARVAEGSGIGFCFDTGHVFIGGSDPVAFARDYAARITHVHLKDVRLAVATRVRAGELSYYDGVLEGLYAPLGQGDIDLAAIIGSLSEAGYDGWYVLEQDNVIRADPAPGEGPILDAVASVAHLRGLLGE